MEFHHRAVRANSKETYFFLVVSYSRIKGSGGEIARVERENTISQKGCVSRVQIKRACPSAAANRQAVSPPGIVYRLSIISGGARANGANIRETPS